MRNVIRACVRRLGFDIVRFRPQDSASAQLARTLDVCRIDVVFDVGANTGQFASGLREAGYLGRIVSFEPLRAEHAELVERSARDPAWQVHSRSAVGPKERDIDLNVAGNSYSSSVLPMLEVHSDAAVGSAYVDVQRVPMIRLDTIIDRYLEEQQRLFIKIDAQGFEWQILDGASRTLSLAHGLLCELSLVPLYLGQRLWQDLIGRLDDEGFMLWAIQKGFTDQRTGQSLQVDGIFLRRGTDLQVP